MQDEKFELRLASGKVVTWAGKDGIDAAVRYVDAHRDATVVAWRRVSMGIYTLGSPGQIIG